MTRIATFNVNGVNGRQPVLLKWLGQTDCDVICLQELKTPDEKFPVEAIRGAGFGAIWHGQKSYNGVSMLARGRYPVERRRGLPGDPDDTRSPYLEAQIDDLVVGCIYLPNGKPAPGPKFDYKLRWFERLATYSKSLLDERVVLCGDDNVVPAEIDAVVPRRCWAMQCSFRKAGRPMRACCRWGGWTRCEGSTPARASTPTGIFSYRGSYDRSSGLRMDHLLASPSLAEKIRDAGVDVETRGWEKPSDHAPPWIDLGE